MDIYRLLDYDQWATANLLKAVEVLSPAQFVQDFSGSLTSVRQQFVHLLLVQDRYCARMAQEAVPDVSIEDFATPQDLVAYEAQMRRRLNKFIDQLKEDDLSQVQQHATRKGLFRASTAETLLHMVNHATYHRGQIACLLKLHDVDFADTDFIIYINRSREKQ